MYFLGLLLLLGIAGVVVWMISASAFLIARTASGSTLGTATSTRERAAAEEMYALILSESMAARERAGKGSTNPLGQTGQTPRVMSPPPPPRRPGVR